MVERELGGVGAGERGGILCRRLRAEVHGAQRHVVREHVRPELAQAGRVHRQQLGVVGDGVVPGGGEHRCPDLLQGGEAGNGVLVQRLQLRQAQDLHSGPLGRVAVEVEAVDPHVCEARQMHGAQRVCVVEPVSADRFEVRGGEVLQP